MKISMADTNNLQRKDFKLHREFGSGDYLFVLFKSPSKVLVDGKYIDVNTGNCIFFSKHKIQSYFPVEDTEFLHDFMHFDLENDFETMLMSSIPKDTVINLSLPNNISEILLEIKNELHGVFVKYKEKILSNLGMVFLYRIKSELEIIDIDDTKRRHFNKFYNLRAEIYQRPHEDWTIDCLCARIYLSRSYFQHLYKLFFSVSCTEDVINARISLAKLLLTSGNMPIKEITKRCGYANTEHFIRQFKAYTGMSPTKFRTK